MIQHYDIKNSSLKGILIELNHEDRVKLGLFCVEDISFTYDGIVSIQDCKELIEKWLEDRNSVTDQELIDSAKRCPIAFSIVPHVAYAAVSPIYSYSSIENAAIIASNRAYRPITYYINIAESFLSKSTNKNPMYKSFLDKPDLSSIMAMLDYAEDDNEDIVIHHNNEFIFNSHGHILKANSKRELAELIMKNKWALDYLQRLYK